MAKILLIDHSTFILQKGKNLFFAMGQEVKTGQSASEAYELLDSGEIYDLILLNASLPDEDGISALKHIKAKYPRQKIVMTGSESEADIKSEVLGLGALDFVEKPLTDEKVNLILLKCGG